MILRRLTEHVKAQNWFAVTIDFVIGVFVGIQVSNWNAARLEAASDRRALALFIDELRLMSEEAGFDLARVTQAASAREAAQ